MDTLKGTITHLSQVTKRHVNWNRTGVSNSPRLPSVRYEYIAEMSVDGEPARLSLSSPAHLDQDDEVALAGLKVFGKLHAYAYKNLSKNVTGHGDILGGLLFGVFTFAIGFLLTPRGTLLLKDSIFSNPYRNSGAGDIFLVVRWGFWAFSLFGFVNALKNLLAFRSVKDV